MEVSDTMYKISVHSNIALFTIFTEVTISDSFSQGITSFYVNYIAIQAQVVCKLNLKKRETQLHVNTLT